MQPNVEQLCRRPAEQKLSSSNQQHYCFSSRWLAPASQTLILFTIQQTMHCHNHVYYPRKIFVQLLREQNLPVTYCTFSSAENSTRSGSFFHSKPWIWSIKSVTSSPPSACYQHIITSQYVMSTLPCWFKQSRVCTLQCVCPFSYNL